MVNLEVSGRKLVLKLLLTVLVLRAASGNVLAQRPTVETVESGGECGTNPLLILINAARHRELTADDVIQLLALNPEARQEVSSLLRAYEECLRIASDGVRYKRAPGLPWPGIMDYKFNNKWPK